MSRSQKVTLVADVTESIQTMILEGEVKPGELLPPRKVLAERFGVGLSTIQEATQGLIAMGMLDSRPGKGTWVRPDALDTVIPASVVTTRLGQLDAHQLYDARAVVEVALTEFAAARATDDDIAAMQQALDKMKASLDDDEAFVAADLSFHKAVAAAGRNDLLAEFYNLAHKLLEEVLSGIIQLEHVKEEGLLIQRDITRAIASHDVKGARRAAQAHMQIVARLLDEWLDE